MALGGLAFVASAVVGGKGDFAAGIVSGLLNPFFFIGVPLGLYWRHQAKLARHGHKGAVESRSEQMLLRRDQRNSLVEDEHVSQHGSRTDQPVESLQESLDWISKVAIIIFMMFVVLKLLDVALNSKIIYPLF